MNDMHFIRHGSGKPLLLLHGIGGSWRSWQTIIDDLAKEREVIAVDLPGFGDTPPLPGDVSISTLADAVTEFLRHHNLLGIDAVGSSMGARLVLELARRGGVLGAVVSLDPGGFWRGWEIPAFYYSVAGSIRLIRALQPLMPALTGNVISRSVLFAQFSAKPWRLSQKATLDEVRTYAASPSFDELLYNLAYGEKQQGAPKGTIREPLVIGWGRQDRVCFPYQAQRALKLFPDAQLYWFDECGHLPQWDQPQETVQLILRAISGQQIPEKLSASRSPQPARSLNKAAVVGGVLALLAGGVWLAARQSRQVA
ncbi:Pimeloyl-ACP methyl ester carboxylesterase [Hymenobacter gelipurpurascens]|uniref:Pimeloyl-ACP methyl ester carboxylesterase n=1 Tax=Hymenobacter gelipurpurascens TaxID=89968 RepID=A0A212UEJ3_9BACT|nr:alpha/beta fold hydrolase [Hymenobacter gelipurpurascens]SNC76667.1 Pimeloyl-ACP methyl ester carboxylesterase [Hymenobacter gelipurpurascens]